MRSGFKENLELVLTALAERQVEPGRILVFVFGLSVNDSAII